MSKQSFLVTITIASKYSLVIIVTSIDRDCGLQNKMIPRPQKYRAEKDARIRT
mgnify:CR=1 FL=1